MAYKVKLINRTEREATIRSNLLASERTVAFHDFRSHESQLRVIRVPSSLPIYRMANFRTFTDQTEYRVRNQRPINFFLEGQENESVQQIQHEILVALARTGREGSVTPIIEVLKKEQQREDILITSGGVVVNGNRRLAAMRELYAEDAAANSELSHVNCMVLPEDATPDDIVDIEACLQAKPETKLDYDWIGDSELISKLISMGRKPDQVAANLSRKEKEIRNSIRALAEADMYLKDWAKAEGEYSRVKDGEQFFKDLPDLLSGKEPQLEEASRVIAWTLFDNRNQLGGRLYAFNITIGRKAADVLERVANEFGTTTEKSTKKGDQGKFEVSLDDDESEVSYETVIDTLKSPQRREEDVEILLEACKSIIESEQNQKSGSAALKAITTAHSKLLEVDLSKAAAETHAAMDKQLEAVIKKANDLRSRLSSYGTQSPPKSSIQK